MDTRGLAGWLAGWDDAALTALLERRPDVLVGRPPGTLGQLAERLARPESIDAALRGLAAPAVQAIEALQALGERRTRGDLIGLLAGFPGPDHETAVDAVLAELTATALVWPAGGERLAVPAGLSELFPRPLGLGPTLRELWQEQYADDIGRALRALGGRAEGRKAEKLEALLGLLADPDRIRERAAQAPTEVAEGLRRRAWEQGDEEDDYIGYRFEPRIYRQEQETERWGVQHGLLVGRSWGPAAPMAAEVALALRGPDFRAPFTPRPPEITTRPVSTEEIESATAAAVTSFAGHALALLDRLARSPVPRLAGGGIGVRELGRLTKELAIDELEVRLLLEVAAAGGLLRGTDDGLTVTDLFVTWRAAEPAKQVGGLLVAWWAFPGIPSEARDQDGKALPALRRRDPCAGCQAARIVLLQVARTLPASRAADRAGLTATARWSRPMVHVLPQDAAEPLATVWQEAELLGTLAAGALSPLGNALLGDDVDELQEHLRRLLPRATDAAAFGSDLTALVAGTPSGRITALLDSCADRESSGGAVTWRFSPASVRRALDDGATADGLVEQLAAVTDRALPQPLAYLIGDVGRRHGRLRLSPAVSIVRSDDEALLAEVAADRRLAKLGLQLIAPTVLSCAVPFETAMARLREVGYFPMPDPAARPPAGDAPPPAGNARPPAVSPRQWEDDDARPPRRQVPGPRPVVVESGAVARGLLERRETGLPALHSGVAHELALAARQLSPAEIDWLAAAVEDGGRVRIQYFSASGATTRRVIEDPDLDGGMLYAWCELRRDERVFSVSRILSVAPVG